jgi:hypothetical protein
MREESCDKKQTQYYSSFPVDGFFILPEVTYREKEKRNSDRKVVEPHVQRKIIYIHKS